MDFVTIGNAGNADDDTGHGGVGYNYRMGVNEVSRGMIDTYNSQSSPALTMSDMTSFGGNGVNRPATGISWNEAARFVNWLNTSKSFSAAYKFSTAGNNDDIALWSQEMRATTRRIPSATPTPTITCPARTSGIRRRITIRTRAAARATGIMPQAAIRHPLQWREERRAARRFTMDRSARRTSPTRAA